MKSTISNKLLVVLGLWAFAVFGGACASKKTEVKKTDGDYGSRKIAQIYEATYSNLNWRDKIKIFSDFAEEQITPSDYTLFDKGFNDESDLVVLSVFKGIGDKKIEDFRERYVKLLDHKNNIVRYKVYLQIFRLANKPEDLNYAQKGLTDKEWMVKDLSLRIIRKFPEERQEKKLFYNILFKINSQNAAIVQEVFKTLRWYNDERSFDYMFKRALASNSNLELIYLIKEMAHYNKEFRVQNWLRNLRDSHDSLLVRNTAREALSKK